MTEDFLHYLWRFKKFKTHSLRTVQDQPILIYQAGTINTDSGPDFSNARISIDEQLWAGNVEIHRRSSDWDRHGHQSDKAYNNVILHVVYEHDRDVYNTNGISLPTLELQGLFNEQLYIHYEQLLSNKAAIPCENHLKYIPGIIRESQVERALVQRLGEKCELITQWLHQNKNDWNATFYQWLCRGSGLKVNAEPMRILAQNIPWVVILKHKHRLDHLEALFFGVAGMLEEARDEYSDHLLKEFRFLKHKYQLPELGSEIWKYARLRPAAFPTLRIAQCAALLHTNTTLFQEVMKAGTVDQLKVLLTIEVSDYWKEHYRFGKITDERSGIIGETFRDTLIINVMVPFLFVYGMYKDEPFYKQRAMDLLDQMKAENNAVSRIYKNLGFEMKTAFHSQGVIQLNTHYCKPKKCLNCAIGIDVMKTKNDQ